MEVLERPASLADGDMTLLLQGQPCPLLLDKRIGGEDQGPEAHNGRGRHELVLIQAEQIFGVAKKHLHIPPRGDVAEQRGHIGVQVARGPVACRGRRSVEGGTGDDELTAVEGAHPCLDNMDVDLARLIGVVALARPLHQREVVGRETGSVLRERLPAPALLRLRVGHAQRAVGLEAGRDQEPPVARRLPQPLGSVPTIEQDVRARPRHRRKGADVLLHQVDFALEGHRARGADALLLVEPGRQRTAPPQEDVQPLDQGMPPDPRVGRAGVVVSDPFHLLALGFSQRGVVADEVPGHEGFLGAPHLTGARLALTVALGLHQRGDLRLEAGQPRPHDRLLVPGCARDEPAQAGDARTARDLPPQPRECARVLTQQQPQQHGHEVLILRLAEAAAETRRPLAYTRIKAYNRNRHGVSPGYKGV